MRLPNPTALPISQRPTSHTQSILFRRQITNKQQAIIIVLSLLVGIAVVSILIVFTPLTRWLRRPRDQEPSKKRRSWSLHHLLRRKRFRQGRYEQACGININGEAQAHPLESSSSSSGQPNDRRQRVHGASGRQAVRENAAVDRNTSVRSVRSVMTLPVYRATAGNNEQVLAREGERDGVDIIVDLPTEEAEEALREDEMDAIYQIRLARREQIAERDELRQQRREARQRGDRNALAAATARSRAASNNSNLESLRREVTRIQEQRLRSVSSVSYADLGVARHDGTRIRASSNDSERMELLSDVASIAVSTQSLGYHPERSTSSLVSIDSDQHHTLQSIVRARSRSTGEDGAGSNTAPDEVDMGVERISPPEYDDVPLGDDGEATSTTLPSIEPPPEYFGRYEHIPRDVDVASLDAGALRDATTESSAPPRMARGVGGVPQLPSLRISGLPSITIEPSSAVDQAQGRQSPAPPF